MTQLNYDNYTKLWKLFYIAYNKRKQETRIQNSEQKKTNTAPLCCTKYTGQLDDVCKYVSKWEKNKTYGFT